MLLAATCTGNTMSLLQHAARCSRPTSPPATLASRITHTSACTLPSGRSTQGCRVWYPWSLTLVGGYGTLPLAPPHRIQLPTGAPL
jgi:hypothetical protein